MADDEVIEFLLPVLVGGVRGRREFSLLAGIDPVIMTGRSFDPDCEAVSDIPEGELKVRSGVHGA